MHVQVPSLLQSSFLAGHHNIPQAYRPARQAAACRVLPVVNEGSGEDKFRLHNLAPQKGATRKAKRVGRGVSAGQVGSCLSHSLTASQGLASS